MAYSIYLWGIAVRLMKRFRSVSESVAGALLGVAFYLGFFQVMKMFEVPPDVGIPGDIWPIILTMGIALCAVLPALILLNRTEEQEKRVEDRENARERRAEERENARERREIRRERRERREEQNSQ